jgi:plasmid stability protein
VATVQIREVPEESYEVLRRRARRAGQSLQSYLREQLITLASRPTKQEVIQDIETVLATIDQVNLDPTSILADRDAERR